MMDTTPAKRSDALTVGLGLLTVAVLTLGIFMAFVYAPTDRDQGDAQRIFYIHVPMAWLAYLAMGVVLVGSVGYFAYRRLWPLVRRAINPVYAAQTIERSSPTLKNSLINLLLFRQHRAEISDAVYKTLEEQAAHRLTRVPVDAADPARRSSGQGQPRVCLRQAAARALRVE